MSKNVAVFVDVANLYYAARGQDVDVDYVALLKHATKGRDLIRAYAYSGLDPENENQKKFLDFLTKNGYRVVAKDIRKFGDGRVKANLDIELVVDLFRLADRMDVAVIVSGDGDFAPAIRALQDVGVRCEVISFKPNTSSDLFAVADEFHDAMKISAIGRQKDTKGVGAPGDAGQGSQPGRGLPRSLAVGGRGCVGRRTLRRRRLRSWPRVLARRQPTLRTPDPQRSWHALPDRGRGRGRPRIRRRAIRGCGRGPIRQLRRHCLRCRTPTPPTRRPWSRAPGTTRDRAGARRGTDQRRTGRDQLAGGGQPRRAGWPSGWWRFHRRRARVRRSRRRHPGRAWTDRSACGGLCGFGPGNRGTQAAVSTGTREVIGSRQCDSVATSKGLCDRDSGQGDQEPFHLEDGGQGRGCECRSGGRDRGAQETGAEAAPREGRYRRSACGRRRLGRRDLEAIHVRPDHQDPDPRTPCRGLGLAFELGHLDVGRRAAVSV